METTKNQSPEEIAFEQRMNDTHAAFLETMQKLVEKHPKLLLAEVAHVMLNISLSINMEFIAMQSAMLRSQEGLAKQDDGVDDTQPQS